MQRAGDFKQAQNCFQNIERPRRGEEFPASDTQARNVEQRSISSFRESQERIALSSTAPTETNNQRRNATNLLTQNKTLTQEMLNEIKESIEITEATQIATQIHINSKIKKIIKRVWQKNCFLIQT